MHFDLEAPSHVIYFIYGPFCHQFAFRSFFLFGEQPVYPRAISGTTLKPYESYIMNFGAQQRASEFRHSQIRGAVMVFFDWLGARRRNLT